MSDAVTDAGAPPGTEPRYLMSEEVGRLLGRVTDTFRPIAACCALAGLRVSEALGLTWGDVDFDAKTITVTGQLGAKGERGGHEDQRQPCPRALAACAGT
jgi:integrase